MSKSSTNPQHTPSKPNKPMASCEWLIISLLVYTVFLLTYPYTPVPLDAADVDTSLSLPIQFSDNVTEWCERGDFYWVNPSLKVFYVDHRTGDGDSTLVFIHGFPSSSFDYRDVVDVLEDKYDRIVLFDLPGFGLSDKPSNFSYSIMQYADFALKLWMHLGVRHAHVVSHDMGDSVLTEILYRRDIGVLPSGSIEFDSVTFTNGGMRIELADLRVTQKLMRIPKVGDFVAKLLVDFDIFESVFRKQIKSLHLTNDNALSEYDLSNLVSLVKHKGGMYRIPQLGRYIDERYQHQPKWIGLFLTWSHSRCVEQIGCPLSHYMGCSRYSCTCCHGREITQRNTSECKINLVTKRRTLFDD
eukprot:TRINITY_DN4806_c0_g1_i3.p1 TRINITY_DN4806_c0_g1~~TRINITY_DN4806_c0_g1_i3.p1  ORF type:complete len:357 (-),score=54.22 TRINITY_DN4806_c0_g1_i3:93-1163(-)